MEPDAQVCLRLVGDLGALDVADLLVCLRTSEDNVGPQLGQPVTQHQTDGEIELSLGLVVDGCAAGALHFGFIGQRRCFFLSAR